LIEKSEESVNPDFQTEKSLKTINISSFAKVAGRCLFNEFNLVALKQTIANRGKYFLTGKNGK
jgi:hypothetical protein